jgi:hypothetical protein
MAENRPQVRLVAADGTRLGVYADYTKNVKETMPAASAEYADVSVFYVGKQTDDFAPGHLYTCIKEGSRYTWVDATPTGNNGSGEGENDYIEYTFKTTSTTGSVVSIDKENLGVDDIYPEFDLVDSLGYNISADTRISRRWDKGAGVYNIVYLGGWPAGTWTLKSVGKATIDISKYTYSKTEIDQLFIDNSCRNTIQDSEGDTLDIDTLLPATYYIHKGELATLNMNGFAVSTKESVIYFTTGTDFQASFPARLKWVGEPNFEDGKTYVVVINYGIATWGEVI